MADRSSLSGLVREGKKTFTSLAASVTLLHGAVRTPEYFQTGPDRISAMPQFDHANERARLARLARDSITRGMIDGIDVIMTVKDTIPTRLSDMTRMMSLPFKSSLFTDMLQFFVNILVGVFKMGKNDVIVGLDPETAMRLSLIHI